MFIRKYTREVPCSSEADGQNQSVGQNRGGREDSFFIVEMVVTSSPAPSTGSCLPLAVPIVNRFSGLIVALLATGSSDVVVVMKGVIERRFRAQVRCVV